VGVGINQVAFGRGNDAWFTGGSTTPQSASGTPTAARLNVPIAWPFAVSPGMGMYVRFDHDDSKVLELTGPDATMSIDTADTFWASFAPMLQEALAGKGTIGRDTTSDLYFESLITGSSSSVEILDAIGKVWADGTPTSNFFPLGSAVGSDGVVYYEEDTGPVLDPSATTLYDEFATQFLSASDLSFVNPETFESSNSITRAIQFRFVRGRTASAETHGEFALYGGYNALTGSRLMVDWVARETRITKSAQNSLETTLILIFDVAN